MAEDTTIFISISPRKGNDQDYPDFEFSNAVTGDVTAKSVCDSFFHDYLKINDEEIDSLNKQNPIQFYIEDSDQIFQPSNIQLIETPYITEELALYLQVSNIPKELALKAMDSIGINKEKSDKLTNDDEPFSSDSDDKKEETKDQEIPPKTNSFENDEEYFSNDESEPLNEESHNNDKVDEDQKPNRDSIPDTQSPGTVNNLNAEENNVPVTASNTSFDHDSAYFSSDEDDTETQNTTGNTENTTGNTQSNQPMNISSTESCIIELQELKKKVNEYESIIKSLKEQLAQNTNNNKIGDISNRIDSITRNLNKLESSTTSDINQFQSKLQNLQNQFSTQENNLKKLSDEFPKQQSILQGKISTQAQEFRTMIKELISSTIQTTDIYQTYQELQSILNQGYPIQNDDDEEEEINNTNINNEENQNINILNDVEINSPLFLYLLNQSKLTSEMQKKLKSPKSQKAIKLLYQGIKECREAGLFILNSIPGIDNLIDE